MGYRVQYLIKGEYLFEDYPNAAKVFVQQNHLHLQDKAGDVIAVYQSGWWIKAFQIENKKL